MRFAFLTFVCFAGSMLASVPGCENRSCSDCLSSTVAKKPAALAATKGAPNDAKPAEPVAPEPNRKLEDRRTPAAKPCRPAHLFM